MRIGENILLIRRSKKLSQKDLAEAAGISHAYMSRVETGVIERPSMDTVASIARVMGVTVQDIVAGDQAYINVLEAFGTPGKRKCCYLNISDTEIKYVKDLVGVLRGDNQVAALGVKIILDLAHGASKKQSVVDKRAISGLLRGIV